MRLERMVIDRIRKRSGTSASRQRTQRTRLGFEQLEARNLLAISFDLVGSFNSLVGQAKVLQNPTSLAFGPDGRLYVSEQNGTINAFTVDEQQGQYLATAHEELTLASGDAVVRSIQNHDDLGAEVGLTDRQVTGLVVAGTATHPVLYVSSSDPRISFNGDVGLDTNSGVVSRVTWTGSTWESVDIIRGLPRSEENHAVNGMVLSADGTKLYAQVGGHTNNGAPSQFFSYTGEYALSGALLEIDLTAIDLLPVLTDPHGGQNGAARQYVYDLPTLDDPTVVNDGTRESADGLDVAGPWGGNDGFNMAILPSDAPLRIYADGFRNQYDIVLTQAGQFYTIDNGSNANLGGDPITDPFGAPTQQPNSGGTGDPEPLFLIEAGGYYGHPNPTRANQDLAWTIYDDTGTPDVAASPNTVADLSTLVPSGLSGTIASGFIIDPTKFTGDPTRLEESGVRVPFGDPSSSALVTLGTSTNGLTEYTGAAFDGALLGTLVTTQFNGNVTLLNLNATGDGIEPLIGPGVDEILGTADDVVVDADGIFPIATGQSQPLDVTMGPDGTLWVAEFGDDNIKVLAPSDLVFPNDPDFDNDGLLNTVDPFLRDATNGGQLVLPGETYLWDFDANQDGNLPGPNGYGGGLTGVMVDGTTDFEQFFQQPSTRTGQIINLDNAKFTTAAGGGTTVIEFASNGDATGNQNDGEFLFHTGVTIAPTVDTFNVRWNLFNPGDAFVGDFQQIGGYLGTGEQSNFLKVVAAHDANGEIQVVLEDADVATTAHLQADDLFDVLESDSKRILIDLEVDPTAETATPTITYETATGQTVVVGTAISLSGTAVLDVIRGDYIVGGQTTGLAVGLYSSNTGQLADDAFQAIFDGIEISATGDQPTTLYRVNAGGPEVPSLDNGPNWSEDTETNPSPHLLDVGNNRTTEYPSVVEGATVPSSTPAEIFHTERDDNLGVPNLLWAFDAPVSGYYEVRLFVANGCECTDAPDDRIFDVAVEGQIRPNFEDIDPTALFGHEVGGMLSNIVEVTDGSIDIEFLHDKQRPLINGIEIILLPTIPPGEAKLTVTVNSDDVQKSNFGQNAFQITNTGVKNVTRVDISVDGALYHDVVFDPFGQAGDSASKPLEINTAGATGVVDPAAYNPYGGAGGIAGYDVLTLLFDDGVDGGFEPGETIGFSIDLDSNSIAGALKSTLDAGANPAWDVGGVSGAEMIGSTFTVTFDDGTSASGQLHGANNQAGAQGVASQESPELSPILTANGLPEGGVGTYSAGGPTVVVDGPAGRTARVVLTKGIVQPQTNNFTEPYATQFAAQQVVLAASNFPANNAAEFQTVDVVLTGVPQDISSLFDFTQVPIFDLPLDEDKLPLGFVAGVIDPSNDDLPLGPVSAPIYLHFDDGTNSAPLAFDDHVTVDADAVLVADLFAHNGHGPDFDPNFGDVIRVAEVDGAPTVGQSVTLSSGATVVVEADGTLTYDPNGAFDDLFNGERVTDAFQYTLTDGVDTDTAEVTVTIVGTGGPNPARLLVVDDATEQAYAYDVQLTLHSTHALDPTNDGSRGLAAAEDGSTYWVVDADRNVYVYDADDALLHQWQFSGFAAPEGITVYDDDLWIVSNQTDTVYFFAGGADYASGTHAPTSSFALDVLNSVPQGITTDGSSLWVVNDASNAWKTFKYSLAGNLLGSWDLHALNRNARGISLDPTSPDDLLVVNDAAQNLVFRYTNVVDQTAGVGTLVESLPLDAANVTPRGIAVFVPEVSADFDEDGDIDGIDFLIWQRGAILSSGATRTDGDANDDGVVDGLDLAEWQDTYAEAEELSSIASPIRQSEIDASLIDAALAIGLADRNLADRNTEERDWAAVKPQPLVDPITTFEDDIEPVQVANAQQAEVVRPSRNDVAEAEPWPSEELLQRIFGSW